jgi:hypothetical protein
MKRVSAASVLLLVGGVLVIAGLPLQWSTVASTVGSRPVSTMTGLDYAGYDIATTLVLALLLIASSFAVAAGRWGQLFGLMAALLSCFWAALVLAAAASPSAGASATVNVSIGAGAYVVGVGAGLALVGAIMSLRGRNVAAVASGATSSV